MADGVRFFWVAEAGADGALGGFAELGWVGLDRGNRVEISSW